MLLSDRLRQMREASYQGRTAPVRQSIARRARPRATKRSRPRRGRVIDEQYLAWIHTQPCMISGKSPVTAHHVRRYGELKNDYRTLPLAPEYHMKDFGATSIEALGKVKFERAHGVKIERAIVEYNRRYEQETGRKVGRA